MKSELNVGPDKMPWIKRSRDHAPVLSIEVIDGQEQADTTRKLVADRRQLSIAARLGKKHLGLPRRRYIALIVGPRWSAGWLCHV